MEVRIRPMPGCLMVILGVCSLGVAPLAIKMKEKHWPRTVDDSGLTTRGGRFVAWPEFTRIVKVVTNVDGTVTERYDLHAPTGTVGIVLSRMEDSQTVFNYIWERLPESAKAAVD